MKDFLISVSDHIRQMGYPIYTVSAISKGGAPQSIRLMNANPCQNSYSVAKMFVVTAIGLLCDKGMLSTEDKVIDVLSEELGEDTLSRMDKEWFSVTVDTALSHGLALPSNFLDIDCGDPSEFGRDYLSYMLTYPLTGKHGERRIYTDGAYYLLSRVAEHRAGKPLSEFLWEELFFDLGFKEVAFSTCPMSHCIGATGLYVRTEDMVKLGQIYLGGGVYGGKRFLSENWVNTVFEQGYELRPICDGVYGKGGMRGQMLAVLPGKDLVIGWHGCGSVDAYELLSWVEKNYN